MRRMQERGKWWRLRWRLVGGGSGRWWKLVEVEAEVSGGCSGRRWYNRMKRPNGDEGTEGCGCRS